jgi:hypothetical protein
MIYLFPILISLAAGTLLITLITGASTRPLLHLFAGGVFGLGTSAFIGFSSLIIMGEIHPAYLITTHLALFAVLFGAQWVRDRSVISRAIKAFDRTDAAILLVAALMTIPVALHANLFPFGGWDAWSCWNMKARFLFLGGQEWTNMFDPALWRSNIAYPFLLPLVNVWLWCFSGAPDALGPRIMTCVITFLTAGLLAATLRELTGKTWSVLLAPVWMFSISFIVKLASSQYSDHVVGLYFLLTLAAFCLFQRSGNTGWLLLTAAAAGFLSFSKSEGLVLSGIVILLMTISLLASKPKFKNLLFFGGALALFFLPTVIFQLTWSTNSHTFINGLSSTEKPANMMRLLVIGHFFQAEFLSVKWMGFWVAAALAAGLNFRRAFTKELVLIPLAMLLYLAAVAGVYYINTFFEIVWWLGSTLNRILFALMPTTVLWVFLSFKK